MIDAPGKLSTSNSVVQIAGRVQDESQIMEVTVNGRPVTVETDASFRVRRGVPQGASTIVVTTLDEWAIRPRGILP